MVQIVHLMKCKRLQLALWSGLLSLTMSAQPVIKVSVSADTVGVGDKVEVTYSIENGQGRLTLPDMSGVPVISGPNSSSSFIYQQGRMQSNQTYSFQLLAREEGVIRIPATTYRDKEQEVEIAGVNIVVSGAARQGPGIRAPEPPSPPATTREKRKF